MQNEQTPAAGPLTAESVKLLQPGDWLFSPVIGAQRFVQIDADDDTVIETDGDPGDRYHFARDFTFLGRPDQDGWIAHDGSVKGPVDGTGMLCDGIMSDDREYLGQKHPRFWHLVSKWRPHAPVSRPGDGLDDLVPLSDDPAVAALCDSSYRAGALAGWNAAQHDDPVEANRIMARIRSVEPGALAPIIERNRRRAALTPPAEPVSRPAGEGEREAVARLKEIAAAIEFAPGDGISFRESGAVTLAKDLRTILSLLSPAAPDAGGGWMPMDTAPKDGTKFEARCGSYWPFTCHWDGERFIHHDPDDGAISYNPDRWRPLTASPSSLEQAGTIVDLQEVYQHFLAGDLYEDYDRADELLGKMRRAIAALQPGGEHSGDRHARCRDFARQTLAALQQGTQDQ